MRNRFFFVMLLMLSSVVNLKAQSFLRTDYGIKSIIDSLVVELQFYNASTVRVIKFPVKSCFDKKSLSVVSSPQKIDLAIKEKGKKLIVKSESIRVILNLEDGSLSFFTNQGEKLLSEKSNGTVFMDYEDSGIQTYSVGQAFKLSKNEAIYGLGQQQQGKMV